MKKLLLTTITLFSVALLTSTAHAQSLVLKWRNTSANAGFGNNLTRYIAVAPSGNVLAASRSPSGNHIYRYNPTTGALLTGEFVTTSVSGGLLSFCGMGVDSDGAVYACNVATPSSTAFKIYKWSSETSGLTTDASTIFSSTTFTTLRIGDVFAVEGSGNNVRIIVGGSGGALALITNSAVDGTWSNTGFKILSGFQTGTANQSMVIMPGQNKFISKGTGVNAYLQTFNPSSGACSALSITNLNQLHNALASTGPAWDDTTKLFGVVTRTNTTTKFSAGLYSALPYYTTNAYLVDNKDTNSVSTSTSSDQGGATYQSGGAWGSGRYFAQVPGNGIIAYDVTTFKVSDPSNASKNYGQNATFAVVSGGSGLSYQWKKDGANLTDGAKYSGTATATLTVLSVAASDAATASLDGTTGYSCAVTGVSSSSWQSAGASLSVTDPIITASPVNTTVAVNEATTLSVTAAGSATLQYQWRKGGVNLSNGDDGTGTIVGGSTSSTLSLSSVAIANNGASYDVVVSSSASGTGSATSSAAVLTVSDPAVTAGPTPASQSVTTGSSASIAITAAGASALSYQWYQSPSTSLTDSGDFAGTATATLTINPAAKVDAGSYYCVVTDTAGSVTSSSASIAVYDPPSISSDPSSLTKIKGTTANFSVTASGDNISYQWKKNGNNVSNGIQGSGSTVSGATTANLTIASVRAGDIASYTCRVYNNVGPDATSAAATLTVRYSLALSTSGDPGSPTIVASPDKTVDGYDPGDSVQITATASTANYSLDYWVGTGSGSTTTVQGRGALASNPLTLTMNDNLTEQAVFALPSVLVDNRDTNGSGNSAIGEFSATPDNTTTSWTWGSSTATFFGSDYQFANRTGSASPTVVATFAPSIPVSGNYDVYEGHNTGTNRGTNVPYRVKTASGTELTRINQQTSPSGGTSLVPANSSAIMTNFTRKYFYAGSTNKVEIGNDFGTSGQVMIVDAIWFKWSATQDTPVSITSQPTGVSSAFGGSAVFSVSVNNDATGPVTYQWKKGGNNLSNGATVNGSTITGATTASVTVDNASVGDQGDYTCVVSNPDVILTSSAATLTLPPVLASIANQTVGTGTNAVFTASNSSSGGTYQWQKGGNNLSNGGNISGATTISLTILGATPSDNDTYTLNVSNTAGSDSKSATLTVQDPAVISSQPSSASVGGGSNAVFSVSLSQGTDVTYQWRKGGVNLSNTGNISGSTTSSLTVSGVAHSDESTYDVVINNLAASVTSSGATLAVYDPAIISSQPVSVATNGGATVTFHVGISQGTSVAYQWKKGGSPLSNGGNISGATTADLTVANVTDADVGSYSVNLSNPAANFDSATAVLTVDDPSIVTQPASQTNNAGTTAILTVDAAGSGTLQYLWKKNGVAMSDAGNVTGSATSSLTITNVLHADQASYTVDVIGALTKTSDPAVLTVIDPVISDPTGGSVNKGSSYIFSVTGAGTGAGANGAPSATFKYQWYFKGTNVTAVNYVKLVGKTNTTLTITALASTVEGNYFCTVTNAFSASQYPGTNVAHSAAAYLTVNYPIVSVPVVPVTATKIAGNNIVYTAVPTATSTKPFSYQWSLNGSPLTDDGIHIIGATANKLSINNVQAPDAGTYQCTVQNASGSVTSLNTQGLLVVNPDIVKPISLIISPLPNARLTNAVTTTTNNVTTAVLTAPDFVLTGKSIDAGLITDVSVTQQYYDTAGVLQTLSPVSVTLIGALPGLKTWTNNFVLQDGTNIFTAVTTDSGTNHTTSVARKFFFVRTNTLTVNDVSADGLGTGTDTPGTIPAAKFGFGQAANGAGLEVGRKYTIKGVAGLSCFCTNITDGDGHVYTNGSVGLNPTATFIMKDGMVINVNFATNPIVAAGVAGSYNGLFSEDAGVTERSAGFSTIIVRTNLSFSGSVKLDGRAYGVSGKFNLSGDATATVNRIPKGLSNVVFTLHLDWVGATKQITGTVTNTDLADPWVATLTNDLAGLYTAQDARYTAVVPPGAGAPTSSPGGYGSLVITNNALGKMLMLAPSKLGDGTLVSQVIDVSKDGNAPVFCQLYRDTTGVFEGIFQGWLHFDKTAGTVTGTMNHIRTGAAPAALPAIYTGGFSNLAISVTGTNYAPSTVGTRALSFTGNQCTFTVTDCNLGTDSTLTWVLALSTGNAFTRVSGATNRITGTITGSTGAFTLTFLPTGVGPAASATLKSVTGVVEQSGNTGKGTFTGSAQTGAGVITP